MLGTAGRRSIQSLVRGVAIETLAFADSSTGRAWNTRSVFAQPQFVDATPLSRGDEGSATRQFMWPRGPGISHACFSRCVHEDMGGYDEKMSLNVCD
jgi:hypothetical protein